MGFFTSYKLKDSKSRIPSLESLATSVAPPPYTPGLDPYLQQAPAAAPAQMQVFPPSIEQALAAHSAYAQGFSPPFQQASVANSAFPQGYFASFPQIPAVPSGKSSKHRSNERAGINSHEPVYLSGPLNVTGDIKSSSSITLTSIVSCAHSVTAGTDITLTDGCFVGSFLNQTRTKVKAGGNITINGGVSGAESSCGVEAGRDILIYGGPGNFLQKGVKVCGKIDAGGMILLDGSQMTVRCNEKVSCREDMLLKGNVEFLGDVECDGKVTIMTDLGSDGLFSVGGKMRGKGGVYVVGNLEVEGDLYIKSDLSVQGCLRVLGSLTVKGDVSIGKGSTVIVNGEKNISGSERDK